ncbi:MAG TPA: hypothetical protein DF614_01660 [Methylococcaceae bacterium]|nr:hypothetical protein [Methylococcaceae bacterium]
MSKFKIAITNQGGFNHIGGIATRTSVDWVSGFTAQKRAIADAKAKDCADWHGQFDNNTGIAFLVCRKTPRKGWVVVGQL